MDTRATIDYTRPETYERTRRAVTEARTLIREAYVCEDFFAIERDRVLGAGWVAAGCVDALRRPGDVQVADVAGRSLILVRGRDGALRAFYNVCRHRGSRLVEDGDGNVGRFIRCPYHRWAYDLDGRCVGTPLFTGSDIPADQQGIFATDHAPGFDRRDYGLLSVAVATFGPLVLVNLDPDPEPLGDHIGDLADRLAGYRLDEWRLARTAHYHVAANYKLIAENFMEYYHLPWVHPGLVRVSPLEAHHRWQGAGMYSGMCTSPIAANTENGGWQDLEPLPHLSPEDAVSARFIWLFPNIALNVMPNHVFLIHATPTAAGVTEETTYLLARPEAADDPDSQDAIDRLAAFWDTVNREDVAIVERVQRGLATTPFPGGPMCYRFEEPVHRFQNMVADRMVGLRRVPPGDAIAHTPMFARIDAAP